MPDFDPILPPSKPPDPWWKRFFAYGLITIAIVGLCAGAMVLYSYGFFDSDTRDYNLEPLRGMTVEEHNAYVERNLRWGVIGGVIVGLLYCIEEEWRHHRRRARERESSSE